ncbi:ADP-ribosylglycohydrolase-domain-containing protein [Absidia repens]|uniref:ADP-ribosylglycohydrolase-domain-containing protein n=1 Tax=Absidia repens TaxID=90262 RepID=A0A1X2IVG5_9FUNG|nr:ADP-ribosylglycohydrolase-domain-containing protein [Absidia repens]
MRIPSGCSKNDKSTIVDKVKGLIFGAIIGDSLGLATEGMTKSEVHQVYGNGPIRFGIEDNEGVPFLRDSYRASFEDNDFSGDSEQQLLIIQSIMQNGVFSYKEYAKLLQDYSVHGLPGLDKKPVGINTTSQVVVAHPDFLTNPRKAAAEVWQTTNKLRGASGAIVRAALLGVPKFWDGTTVIENTADCCRITHPDPRCMISCVIVSTLVARILRGQDLENEEHENLTSNTNNNNGLNHINIINKSSVPSSLTLPPTPTDSHRMSTSSMNGKENVVSSLSQQQKQQKQQRQTLLNENVTPPPSSPTSSCYTSSSSSLSLHLDTSTTLMKIVRSVIDTNKRILTAPNTDPLFMTPETDVKQTQLYYQQLMETCSYFEDGPVDFGFLQLDALVIDDDDGGDGDDEQEALSRGSFKCLSAGLYSFTRHLPAGRETEYFKHILMDLVMQGGEADTNATVVGALLGVRLGYSQLPSEWVVGLKRWEWLEDQVDEFCSLL